MTYTYDLNTDGVLIIRADEMDRARLKRIRARNHGIPEVTLERRALKAIAGRNRPLKWIKPEDIGALTDAPILGVKDKRHKLIAAYAFMDYAVRCFVDDLIETGKAVFIS